jgi:aminopeptidase N
MAIPALKLFNDLVAPYPYDKLALIIGATRFGGMENSSAIVFGSSLFDPFPNATLSPRFGVRSGIVELVAHEIAHQWFGDSVTEKTWADLWLSEGFATYFAGVFLQSRESEEAFRKYMQVAADSIIRFEREKLVPLHDLETEDLFEMLNTSNYQKGAWVLHMLRSQMGDAAFFDGLRRYYETHKHSVATSEDLRRALEQASGMDLIPFFESWVYGTGHPRYELSWEWQADPGLLRVYLKQRQDQESFPNWVPLEVTTPSRKSRLVLKPTTKQFVAEYPLNEAPTNLEFDPDSTILKEVIIKPLSRTVSN